jgi:NitT/TauT family transport system substrate-binding protein
VNFLVKNGILKVQVPASDLVTNELIEDINKFDENEIAAAAKAYK